MAYVPKLNWVNSDVVYAPDMNRIEGGIVEALEKRASSIIYPESGSSANVKRVTIDDVTSLADMLNKIFNIRADDSARANVATSLQVNSLSALPLRFYDASSSTMASLPGKDRWVPSGGVYQIYYDNSLGSFVVLPGKERAAVGTTLGLVVTAEDLTTTGGRSTVSTHDLTKSVRSSVDLSRANTLGVSGAFIAQLHTYIASTGLVNGDTFRICLHANTLGSDTLAIQNVSGSRSAAYPMIYQDGSPIEAGITQGTWLTLIYSQLKASFILQGKGGGGKALPKYGTGVGQISTFELMCMGNFSPYYTR